MFNLIFWADFIQDVILPRVFCLQEVFEHRILAAFEGLEEEAQQIRNREWERLIHQPVGPDDFDYGESIVEEAEEASITYYITVSSIRQTIINLFAVALYHLFEQELFFIFRNEVIPTPSESPELKEVVKWFKSSGIDIERFRSWFKLYELRLVANTVKHADGKSSRKLKELRPGIFEPPDCPGWNKSLYPRQVFLPLAGEDLYLTSEEIQSYFEAIQNFWIELVDNLRTFSTDRIE